MMDLTASSSLHLPLQTPMYKYKYYIKCVCFSPVCVLDQLNSEAQLQNQRGYKEFPPPLPNHKLGPGAGQRRG